ncbi:peroxisomal coenzyme A diphosphatase NUDT7-like [Mya arenaria]|uniref:peroxisomal coenzyme A diphosphatase NUDT7-like n=1 Tax=Mya arenaria TaxID=6604 RepID=UPI0022E2CA5C|nr:peroxisomal coenzyme A diphosphatase NUDT7-like [Mya arenaria]
MSHRSKFFASVQRKGLPIQICQMDTTSNASPDEQVERLKGIFNKFDIRENPALYNKLPLKDLELRKASVLIPLQYIDGEFHVILTLRSEKLTHHAGVVAFPGGNQDDSDNDHIHTALREAEEEIGLLPSHVKVIGVFFPQIVSPFTLVHPVIGVVDSNFVAKPNENEVSLVFKIPLRRFLSSERTKVVSYHSPVDAVYHIHHFYDTCDGKSVDTFGYTAALCVETALGALQSDKTFVFYNNIETSKDNLFHPEQFVHVLTQILKKKKLQNDSKL